MAQGSLAQSSLLVGTFEMATEMSRHNCLVAVHKHYSVEEWQAFAAEKPAVMSNVAASAGTSKADMFFHSLSFVRFRNVTATRK